MKIGDRVNIVRRTIVEGFGNESVSSVPIRRFDKITYVTGRYIRKGDKTYPYVVKVGDYEFLVDDKEIFYAN